MTRQTVAISLFGAASTVSAGYYDTWCVTYISTYLVPVSVPGGSLSTTGGSDTATKGGSLKPTSERGTSTQTTTDTDIQDASTSVASLIVPESSQTSLLSSINSGSLSLDIEPTQEQSGSFSNTTISTLTDEPTILLGPTTSTDSIPISSGIGINEPAGRKVIFQIVVPDNEKRNLNKRVTNGFVGNENPDVCTFATIFNLAEGQLFDGGVPIFYSGEDFKELSGQGSPPEDAITTNFETFGQQLVLRNSGLPNGEARFCQNSNGLVYIVFSTGPSSCVPVNLAVYNLEQCQNGRLVGVDELTSTTGITNSETATPESISSINGAFTSSEADADSATATTTTTKGDASSRSFTSVDDELEATEVMTSTANSSKDPDNRTNTAQSEAADPISETSNPDTSATVSSGDSSTSPISTITAESVAETSARGVSTLSDAPVRTSSEEPSTIQSTDFISFSSKVNEPENSMTPSFLPSTSETSSETTVLTDTTTFTTTGPPGAGTEITPPAPDETTNTEIVNIEDTTTANLDLPTATEGDTKGSITASLEITPTATIDPCFQLEDPYTADNGRQFDILCNTGYEGAVVYDSIYDFDFEGCLEACAADPVCEGVQYAKIDTECTLFTDGAGPLPDEGYHLAYRIESGPQPERL